MPAEIPMQLGRFDLPTARYSCRCPKRAFTTLVWNDLPRTWLGTRPRLGLRCGAMVGGPREMGPAPGVIMPPGGVENGLSECPESGVCVDVRG